MSANVSLSSTPMTLNGQPLTGGLSGLMNMGGSTMDYVNGAYAFLNQNNATNQAFVSSTASSTQNFVSQQLAPLNVAIAQSAKESAAMMPNELSTFNNFQTMLAQSVSNFGQQSLASINTNTNIGSSNSNSGGSFVCSAICESENNLDDLEILNDFRLKLLKNDEYAPLVKMYYKYAPDLVTKIKQSKNSAMFLKYLRVVFLDKIISNLKNSDLDEAVRLYSIMMLAITAQVRTL